MISLPNTPKVIEKKGNKAIFQIEALYPGYGVTVGNSLRRALFSSLSGSAITKMKIKGVAHEFSTIPGVLEDVVSIGLNLKKLRFKMPGSEMQKARLVVSGEKEVKGSDFDFPSQVELVNKDAHIASLTDKKSKLEIDIEIEKGTGYLPSELRKIKKLEVGVISLDAIFTPIRNISHKVDNMRVGDRTDFDRLLLEVETDGTISPEEAVSRSADILVKHFSLFSDAFPLDKKEKKVKKTKIVEKKKVAKKETKKVKKEKTKTKKHEEKKQSKKTKS